MSIRKRKKTLFAVVVPMFNEEIGAENCVKKISSVLKKIHESVLIIVNDGSSDNTFKILDSLQLDYSFLLASHSHNIGYGAALKTGVELAKERGADYVLFMDSDLTNNPEDIPKFYAKMLLNSDLIKATRYSDGGKASVPLKRFYISYFGNIILRALLTGKKGAMDISNGFRAIKTSILTKIDLEENDFSIIIEEYCKALRHAKTIVNVPVELSDRSKELRPTSFLYKPKVFWSYLKYPIRKFLMLL
jgi:dolichol-phosphate mannosyltransferase